MLRNFLGTFFKKNIHVEKLLLHPEGKRIYRQSHNIRRDQMDSDALKVIYRLNRHGYRSYLVGGCVRDMLLQKRPKDFDVATSATPEQIRRIFSNSRSIGRRFRIVHVFFHHDKIIEVSTFRDLPRHRLQKRKNSNYFMRRDNRFGNPQEDAARRDFTVNGLYFDPRNESIIDYVGGFEDIQKKCLASVSDPNISFQEDPVRMLRVAKFATLLGFKIENKTAAAVRRYRNEIRKSNRVRLLDELVKIFRTAKSAQIFSALYDLELLKSLFPKVYSAGYMKSASFTDTPMGKRLSIADQSLDEREELTTTTYLAVVLADLVVEIFINSKLSNKASYVRKHLLPVCRQMMISKRDRERLFHIYISYSRFLDDPENRNTRPDIFRKKVFFYEAFMFFKIYALSENNEENIQKAMFWEIGPRMTPPEKHTTISTFSRRRGMRRESVNRHSRSASRSLPRSASRSNSRSASRIRSKSRSDSRQSSPSKSP